MLRSQTVVTVSVSCSRSCWDAAGLTGGGLGSVSVCEENHRCGDAGHHVPLVLHGHLLPGLLHPTEPGGRPPPHGVPEVPAEPPGVEDRVPPGGDQEEVMVSIFGEMAHLVSWRGWKSSESFISPQGPLETSQGPLKLLKNS